MKVELKYTFGCKDGFKYTRDTFKEIKEVVDENYEALRSMCKAGDSLNMTMDYTNEYFPKADISAYIHGKWNYYSLRTEVTELI